ncbi:uncharacterized protein [Nicotiana tomentosiformis]|uniref:uncharacterized protein n=1 Tax=Nicotiana tomentosiformis TaxID=4098 RepID=UPI00388C8746
MRGRGDFSVVSCEEEKKGGRPFRVEDNLDFLVCLGLQDVGYYGSQFTWSNNRDPPNTIWESTDSDFVKYFKFLNIWVEHEEYLGKIQQAWSEEVFGNPLYIFHQKLKKVCSTLGAWSRQAFGDIYEEPKRLESLIRSLDEAMIFDPFSECRMNLSKARAEFTRFLKLQESILRQKYRRNKLNIQRIKEDNENLMEDLTVLDTVKRTVTEEDNAFLTEIPTMEEVKNSVFVLDADSAPRPDGLTGRFYQSPWFIIAETVFNTIVVFFYGAQLPRFFTHTCLVMLPKVESPQTFSDIRPISLCNVSNKIIAKLLNSRLSTMLPRIISHNQSGFVKGRAITENICWLKRL